ncbi:MFS transporter [Tsukamurella soli]|uniref:MFS transporter n=1 Tax=Tsukamurella soli TaxID=644556 RepID=A0ABP8J9Y7_9ACTN
MVRLSSRRHLPEPDISTLHAPPDLHGEGPSIDGDGRTVYYIGNANDVHALVENTPDPDRGTGWSARSKSVRIMFLALGGVFVDAYDFSSLSIGTVQLQHEFGLSSTSVGLLSASMAVSALVGAFTGGHLVDRLGRRRMFVLDLWIFVIAALGCAFAPNTAILVAFRLVMGLGVGLDFPVALSFVVEFCRRSKRGLFVNSSYVNWYLAALVGFAVTLVGYLVIDNALLWRVAVGFGAVPALLLIYFRRRYLEESPLWAAHQGDLPAAAEILRRTREMNVQVAPDAATPTTALTPTSITYAARRLFSDRYRPRAVLAAVIGGLQSIEYYAVIFYLPVISEVIFGKGILNAILGGAIFNGIGLIGSLVQAAVCDRTGIRPLALWGSIGSAAALVGVACGHAVGSVGLEAGMLALFMLAHTIGPGPQGMAYAALSFPTRIRGLAIGWGQGMLRLGSVCGFVVFPIMLSTCGFSCTFVALALAPAGIAAVVALIRWDPIGRDVEADDLVDHARTA